MAGRLLDGPLAFAKVPRAPALIRRQRLAHFAIVATKAEWPTVSVAVLLRRVEKPGELHSEGKRVKQELLQFIRQIQSDQRFMSLDKPAIKQSIILRILLFLGWDPFNIDEIYPEYDVGNGTVDFSLRNGDSNEVFLEAMTVGEDLEKYEERLLLYSIQYGVKIAVLTNGITWWLYLPLFKGDWGERRFYTLEVYKQSAEEIGQRFTDFLSKENVILQKASENAEKMHNAKQIDTLIGETLPLAWNKLISESEGWLVDLIAETTEELCGHRPDPMTVQRFIASEIKTGTELVGIPKPQVSPPQKPTEKSPPNQDYTGKSIVSFTFKGERHDVNSWPDLISKICEIMLAHHRDKFEYVLTLAGRKRPYFTKDPKELLTAQVIPGTDIYAEGNLTPMGVVALSKRIIGLFGYKETDLHIEAKL